jgi:putative transposase
LRLRSDLNKKKNIDPKALVLFPIDSTIISLTSKLLWKEGYHLLGEMHAEETSARFHPQVKLFSGINLLTAEPGGILIHFGQGHDSKF